MWTVSIASGIFSIGGPSDRRGTACCAPTCHRVEARPVASNLVRFLDQKAPGLASRIAAASVRRSARHLELFLERMTQWPGGLERAYRFLGFLNLIVSSMGLIILAVNTVGFYHLPPEFIEQVGEARKPQEWKQIEAAREEQRRGYERGDPQDQTMPGPPSHHSRDER